MIKWLQFASAIILCTCCYTSTLLAYIDNLTPMSSEWARTGNRNGAIDAADCVQFNPAGTSFLPQGFHLNVFSASQRRNRDFSINGENPESDYKEDDAINLFPSAFCVLNMNRWSVFGSIDIPNGETMRSYPEGSLTTHLAGRVVLSSPAHNSGNTILAEALKEQLLSPHQEGSILGEEIERSLSQPLFRRVSNSYYEEKGQYHTSVLGVSYKIMPLASFAFGIRYVNADKITKAGLSISDLTENAQAMNSFSPGLFPESQSFTSQKRMVAWGAGGIFGLNISRDEGYHLAFQIKTPVKLYERVVVEQDELDLFLTKEKQRNDLPGEAGIGFAFKLFEQLECELDYTFWFQKRAEREGKSGNEIFEMAGNAWKSGITMAYRLNQKLLISSGLTYTVNETLDASGLYAADTGITENMENENLRVSAGFLLIPVKRVKINVGLSHALSDTTSFNMKRDNESFDATMKSSSTTVAVGFEMSLW